MRRAVTLLELVIVVVIFGLLAAIAIPKFSSGAPSDAEASLRRDLSILRSAIEMYYYDHGLYPAQAGTGLADSAAGTEAAFVLQLTKYTDPDGHVLDEPRDGFRYGPYLRNGIPALRLLPRRGRTSIHVVKGNSAPAFTPSAIDAGWVYNCETGAIVANSDAPGPSGARYDSY